MTNRTPRVSIGLPVYNGEKYVAATLDSLLTQSFTDFELIISDNASTDETANICQQYAARDSRIRYYREETNRGAPWNLARVFREANGEYFKWQAADDLCGPTLLERCVEVLDQDPSVVLCYPQTAVIDSNANLIPNAPGTWQPAEDTSCILSSARPADRVRGILMNTVWCYELFGLARCAVMANTALHRKSSSGGKAFLIEMALQGRFHQVPEILFYNRRHSEQFTMLRTSNAQKRFDQPGKKHSKFSFPHQIGCTVDYAMCIAKASLPIQDRLSCSMALTRYILQPQKMTRVIRNALRGTGMWGGTLQPAMQPAGSPREAATPSSREAACRVDATKQNNMFC